MANSILDIAKRLRLARDRLDDLWESTRSKKKRAEIVKQMVALDKQVMRLISINIKDRGAEYEAATKALGSANRKLGRAIADINKFVEAMEAIAAAVSSVVKILPV